MKTYTIICHRRGRQMEYTGTVAELVEKFKYTLDSGYSYNRKINKKPTTIKGLLASLAKCVRELQGGCFNQDYYELKGE